VTGDRAAVRVAVEVAAPQQVVWDLLTDWSWHREWMVGTTAVGLGAHGGAAVGERIRAVTGPAGIGVVDTMVITGWQPPERCEVRHVGRAVRGTGSFRVEALPANSSGPASRIVWEEQLELPLGPLGRLGWPLVRSAFVAGVRRSLRALGAVAAAEYHGTPPAAPAP
jgi:hypothetical protein